MERIKQKLDEARKQREQIQRGDTTPSEGVGSHNWSASRSDKHRLMDLNGNHARLLLGTALIIMSVMVTWWGISSNDHEFIRLSGIEELDSQQGSKTRSAAVEEIDLKIAALAEQVDTLTESITQLETKLISAHLTTDSILAANTTQPPSINLTQQTVAKAEHILETLPSPAAGTTDKETSVTKTPRPSSSVAISSDTSASLTAKEHQPPSASNQTAIKMSKNGPWVINLVSTSSKADADRLAKMALSKDIPTEQQQTTVKGTQYWRVQITGFSTAVDARAYADTAKKQLGLKDAWIMKR